MVVSSFLDFDSTRYYVQGLEIEVCGKGAHYEMSSGNHLHIGSGGR